MPQLNPGPWFFILAVLWLLFLSLAPRVLLKHLFPNKMTPEGKLEQNMTPWTWQWH
uniref:ATP synthase complex subunit 8 n=1 Tax=Pleuronichthys cornutus TaxID=244455 RepID=T1P629_PLECR|nr:ATP synthase F0 subunit 8 [Pleuronichthys cornutus]AFC77822.1 ATP synthase subunit 8 [Pleuronichthys cornutus]